MSEKPAKPTFRLTIEALPDEVPAINRLRRLLKSLLRAFGFRCTECIEIKPDPSAAPDDRQGE